MFGYRGEGRQLLAITSETKSSSRKSVSSWRDKRIGHRTVDQAVDIDANSPRLRSLNIECVAGMNQPRGEGQVELKQDATIQLHHPH
jgi:hypothetical protein